MDILPFLVTFLVCIFYSLEMGILVGAALSLAMLCYTTARPKIQIQRTDVYETINWNRISFICSFVL